MTETKENTSRKLTLFLQCLYDATTRSCRDLQHPSLCPVLRNWRYWLYWSWRLLTSIGRVCFRYVCDQCESSLVDPHFSRITRLEGHSWSLLLVLLLTVMSLDPSMRQLDLCTVDALPVNLSSSLQSFKISLTLSDDSYIYSVISFSISVQNRLRGYVNHRLLQRRDVLQIERKYYDFRKRQKRWALRRRLVARSVFDTPSSNDQRRRLTSGGRTCHVSFILVRFSSTIILCMLDLLAVESSSECDSSCRRASLISTSAWRCCFFVFTATRLWEYVLDVSFIIILCTRALSVFLFLSSLSDDICELLFMDGQFRERLWCQTKWRVTTFENASDIFSFE